MVIPGIASTRAVARGHNRQFGFCFGQMHKAQRWPSQHQPVIMIFQANQKILDYELRPSHHELAANSIPIQQQKVIG